MSDVGTSAGFELAARIDPALTVRAQWLVPQTVAVWAAAAVATAVVELLAYWVPPPHVLPQHALAQAGFVGVGVVLLAQTAVWFGIARRLRRAGDRTVRVRFAADAMTVTTFEGAVRLTWDRVRDVRHARGLTAVAARSGGMMIYALPVELDAQQRAAVDGWRVEAARRGPQPAGHEQAEAPQPEEAPGHDPAPDRVVVGAVLEPRHTALLVMARRPPRTWRRTGVLIAAAGVLGLIGLLAIIVSLAPAHPGTVRSTSETVIALVSGLVLVVVSVPWIAAIARQAAGRPPGELGARFAHRAIWGSDPAVTWTFDVDGVDLTTTREQRSLPWSAAPEVAVGRGVLRVGSGRTSVAVPLEFLSTDQISRIRGLSRGSGRSS